MKKSRGYHVVTQEILEQLPNLPDKALMNIFIHHTSAAITINEAADPDVLEDFESIFNYLVPEKLPFLKHTMEGPDDMPAHIKTAMIGHSIQLPIENGKLVLGTWQGIYLCEFRNQATRRKLTVSLYT